jgi:hypothetical protein
MNHEPRLRRRDWVRRCGALILGTVGAGVVLIVLGHTRPGLALMLLGAGGLVVLGLVAFIIRFCELLVQRRRFDHYDLSRLERGRFPVPQVDEDASKSDEDGIKRPESGREIQEG